MMILERYSLLKNIGEYSGKIKNIVDNIYNSDGIVLIYSQFIDGGVIPMALALESIGFTRFGNKASNLFKTSQHPVIDSKTYLPKDKMDNPEEFRPATYTLLTGEKALSPDKVYDLKNLTDEDNKKWRENKGNNYFNDRFGRSGFQKFTTSSYYGTLV